ncbi:Polysialic acid transport protein KpsD precursor [compost metagenome]
MNHLKAWLGRLPLLLTVFSLVSTMGLTPALALDIPEVPTPGATQPSQDWSPEVVIDPNQEVAFDTPEAIRDYQLSVGDTITVNLWATDLRFNQTYTIPFEGRIYLPSIGEVDVNKRTTAQVQSDLLKRLGGRLKGLKASVLLVKTRKINVYVTGLVKRPGIVTVPVLSRLSVALARTGGVLPEGSKRRITLTHADGKSEVLDWYKFVNRGDLKANPRLAAGDVINVPPLGNQVNIGGAVYRPGQYEMLPNETIEDLLFYAHGATSQAALNKASIAHWLNDDDSDRFETLLDLSKPAGRATKLENRDRIHIPANTLTYIPMKRTKVHIQGLVNNEGEYTLTIGKTLRDLFSQAGGPKTNAGLREVEIYHQALSGGTSKKPALVVNAYKLLYENDESQNVEMRDGDLVVVPSNKLPVEDSVINVQGQVGNPGRTPFRVGAHLSDYLNAAGGPLPKANLKDVTVTRAGKSFKVDAHRIMREGKTDQDMELQPGDIVYVPESFFYVSNFQDVVNTLLAAVAVWAAVRPLTGQ